MLFKKLKVKSTINGNLLYENPIYCVLKYKNVGFDKWQTHPSTVGGNLTFFFGNSQLFVGMVLCQPYTTAPIVKAIIIIYDFYYQLPVVRTNAVSARSVRRQLWHNILLQTKI
jgi:hypothetical protein